MVVHCMLHQRSLLSMHSRLVHIVNDVNPMDNGVIMHYQNFVQELNFLDIQQQQQLWRKLNRQQQQHHQRN